MSCGYGTKGFQCDVTYTLGGQVSHDRATEIFNLGQKLGLTEFNPTSVNWDVPKTWKGSGGGIMTEGEGYLLLILFGIGLTLLTLLLTFLERKFGGETATSEQFNTTPWISWTESSPLPSTHQSCTFI